MPLNITSSMQAHLSEAVELMTNNGVLSSYSTPEEMYHNLGTIHIIETGGRLNPTSWTGVKGSMQVTQATFNDTYNKYAAILKAAGVPRDREDPRASAIVGSLYYNARHEMFDGNPTAAAVAYNSGPEAGKHFVNGKLSEIRSEGRGYAVKFARNHPDVQAHLGSFGAGPNFGIPKDEIYAQVLQSYNHMDGAGPLTIAESGEEAFKGQLALLEMADQLGLLLTDEQHNGLQAEMGLLPVGEREIIDMMTDEAKKAYFAEGGAGEHIVAQNGEWYDTSKAAPGEQTQALLAKANESYEYLSPEMRAALKEKNAERKTEFAKEQEQLRKDITARTAGAGLPEDQFLAMLLLAGMAFATGNDALGNQVLASLLGDGQSQGSNLHVQLPSYNPIGSNSHNADRQKYYDDNGIVRYSSDAKSQLAFAGNGSFAGVDSRLVKIMKTTAEEFPLRVRVVSGRNGRNSGRHAEGKAIDIVIYDDNGNALGSYQTPHTHRIYELFAQAAYLNAQKLHPELVDGEGLDFQSGAFFGDGPNGGYKYGSHDTMDFRLEYGSKFRAGTIMGGLNPHHGWYDNGDFLGGSKPFSVEAFNADMEKLHGFKMTSEQRRLNESAMVRARNTVARYAGRLEARSEPAAVEEGKTAVLNEERFTQAAAVAGAAMKTAGVIAPQLSNAGALTAAGMANDPNIQQALSGVKVADNDNSSVTPESVSGELAEKGVEVANESGDADKDVPAEIRLAAISAKSSGVSHVV